MNGVPDGTLSAEEFADLRNNVMAAIDRRRRRSRVRTAMAIGAAVAAVAGATAGVIATQPAAVGEQNTYYSCYLEPRVTERAPYDVVETDPSPGQPPAARPVADRVAAALRLCGREYEAAGAVVANPTACVLKDHRIAVFPNAKAADAATFCTGLGLSAPR